MIEIRKSRLRKYHQRVVYFDDKIVKEVTANEFFVELCQSVASFYARLCIEYAIRLFLCSLVFTLKFPAHAKTD